MTKRERQKLIRIHGALDDDLGDTDPDCQGMTQAEIREEEPVFWAACQIAKMLPGKWDIKPEGQPHE